MKVHQENTAHISQKVIQKVGNPVSEMVVLATLESFGIRNKDVDTDYGFDSIFDMAMYIFKDLKQKPIAELRNLNELKPPKKGDKSIPISDYLWIKAKLLVQYYPLGIFHLFPIVIQIVCIILFGYSLWTFLGFNVVQSTAVVFGVIFGLIISGGYVQVLGRQASFYWHHQEYQKSKIVVYKLIKSGIKGNVVVFAVLAIVNFLFNLYPFSFFLITFIYAFLIGLLLLVSAPFHTIKHRWAISVAISVGTLLALSLKLWTTLHIFFTHWIGLCVAILISLIFLKLIFKSKIKTAKTVQSNPKKIMVIYRNYKYFFYGALIYVFVFLDRLLAWSAPFGISHKFIFLYEKDYEIGMDLAILIFFMLAGVLEYAIAAFSKFLDIKQKNIKFLDAREFNKSLYKMYWGHIFLLFLTAIGTTTFVYLIVTQPWGYQASFGETLNPLSIKVCVLGGIGYFFLTWGMLNALYLFTLNQPSAPLRALVIATSINLGIGFICSRFLSYEYSVIGMLVGAFVFMVLTIKTIHVFFKKLDYYYYAAY